MVGFLHGVLGVPGLYRTHLLGKSLLYITLTMYFDSASLKLIILILISKLVLNLPFGRKCLILCFNFEQF